MNSINAIKYISSSLEIIEEKKHHKHSSSNQIVINNKVYASLTPNVYAWLRRQMEKAHSAYKAGKMAEASWNILRQRFRLLHYWAIEIWGKEVIAKSLKTPLRNPYIVSDSGGVRHDPALKNSSEKTTTKSRNQDTTHRYPTNGEYPCTYPVSPEAVAKVDAIRNDALSLGWTENGLYQNRGRFKLPCGQDYGLVCFLGKDECIGEVTGQYIEIIRPSGIRHRFYNHDAEQPWIKKEPEVNN